jgi:hypothetical protein
MRFTILSTAVAVTASLALSGSALAAGQSPRTAPAGSQPVGTAVSRGGDSGGGSIGGGTAVTSSGGTETIQSSGRDRQGSSTSGGNRKATARGDRPRGDRSTVGTAGPRTHPPNGGGGGGWDGGFYPPYYWGYGGVGLGYFYYDPFWWGDPWGYGGGYYGGGGGGGYSTTRQADDGELRLKVKPKNAQVFVDGRLEGTVDDFDGTFERLRLPEGPHRVELRLEGHQPLSFEVNIVPDELVTYRGKLEPR